MKLKIDQNIAQIHKQEKESKKYVFASKGMAMWRP